MMPGESHTCHMMPGESHTCPVPWTVLSTPASSNVHGVFVASKPTIAFIEVQIEVIIPFQHTYVHVSKTVVWC